MKKNTIENSLAVIVFFTACIIMLSSAGRLVAEQNEDYLIESPDVPASELPEIRDPFESTLTDTPPPRIIAPVKKQTADLVLEGIGMGPGGAFALINGQIYIEGEEKEGLIISKIRRKEVDIITDGLAMTLYTSELHTKQGESSATRKLAKDKKQSTIKVAKENPSEKIL